MPILSGVGGNFSAVDTDGKMIEFGDYKGKVVILAFGYTNCADICPFTLGYLKSLYSKFTAEEQQNIRIIFVTIDPKYDTPEHLKSFIGHFNDDFIGLSGTQQQVDYIVSLYQAQYNKLSSATVLTDYVRRVNPKVFKLNISSSFSITTRFPRQQYEQHNDTIFKDIIHRTVSVSCLQIHP